MSFKIKCADPLISNCIQASLADNSLGATQVHALVRGSTSVPPSFTFQTLPADNTPYIAQFTAVVEDSLGLWDPINYRFTIPESGVYELTFGLCSANNLSPLPPIADSIFELGGSFRILNSDLSTKEEIGKQTVYGGVSRAAGANLIDVTSLNSTISRSLTAGELVEIFVGVRTTVVAASTLDLLDPVVGVDPAGVLASWFGITKL